MSQIGRAGEKSNPALFSHSVNTTISERDDAQH